MSDEDIKILKKSIQKVKKLKIFKELEEMKELESKKANIKKVA